MVNGDLAQGDRVLVEATVKSVSANGTYVTVEIPVYTVRIPEDKFEPAPVAVPWHCIIPRRDSKFPLDVDTAKRVADWISQHVPVGDTGDDGTVWVKMDDVVSLLDNVGDDSLWFSGDEWQAMLDKANRYDEIVQVVKHD